MANDTPLTKEDILDAAEQVLRRYGPDKTSVMDIAKFLQVSHGSLYRHFASKAALRETVTKRWLEAKISEPLAEIAASSGNSAEQQLLHWLKSLISLKRTYAKEDAELFRMYADVTLEAPDMIAGHVNRLIGQLTAIISRGIQSGEFKVKSAETAASALFAATAKFHHPVHAKEWVPGKIDREFDAVWSLLLNGLK